LQFDAEEIGQRLVKDGYNVSVYCRKWYTENLTTYKGMNLIITPTIPFRSLDVFVHTFTSFLDTVKRDHQIVHLFSFGSYFIIPFLKLFGKKVVVTFGGEPWKDTSHNFLGRLISRISYIVAVRCADVVTAEFEPLRSSTEEKYHIQAWLTPSGFYESDSVQANMISLRFDLHFEDFILFLGRLEKVKRVDWLIRAFKELQPNNKKLVIAGDTKHISYKKYLLGLAKGNKNIIFTGFVEKRLKQELLSNCMLMVLPSISEGGPTVVLEASGYARASLLSDIPPHRWMIMDSKTGFLFDSKSYPEFKKRMQEVLDLEPKFVRQIGNNAKENLAYRFNWSQTVAVFKQAYQTCAI